MTRSILQTIFNKKGFSNDEPSLFFWWNRFLNVSSFQEKWTVCLANATMSHIKLNIKDKLIDIHFLSRRALVRGLVSEKVKQNVKSNLGEVRNFISHEIIKIGRAHV